MEAETVEARFVRALTNLPAMVTDEVANAGKRTYKYLSLSTLLKTIRPVFFDQGLALVQTTEMKGEFTMTVNTVVVDAQSTQRLNLGEYMVKVSNDPQAVGSAVTYARRYSLYAALGIFPDKDDDGSYPHQQVQAQQAQRGNISSEEFNALKQLAAVSGTNLLKAASEVLGRQITRGSELNHSDVEPISQRLGELAQK